MIGVFRTLRAQKFPFRQPKITVVTNITISSKTKLKIQILKKEAREVIAKFDVSLQLPDGTKTPRETGFISDFNNTKFETPGPYLVEIWVDEEIQKTVPFEFVQVSPPPKKK